MVLVLLVIDQIIKVYVKTHFCLGESVRVTDWFFIDFVENNGMAWGMSFIGKFWLSLLRTIAIVVLVWYLHRIINAGTHRKIYIFLVALVLTGAIGNMIDSMFYGLMFSASSPYYVAYQVPFGSGYSEFFKNRSHIHIVISDDCNLVGKRLKSLRCRLNSLLVLVNAYKVPMFPESLADMV